MYDICLSPRFLNRSIFVSNIPNDNYVQAIYVSQSILLAVERAGIPPVVSEFSSQVRVITERGDGPRILLQTPCLRCLALFAAELCRVSDRKCPTLRTAFFSLNLMVGSSILNPLEEIGAALISQIGSQRQKAVRPEARCLRIQEP